MGQQEVQDCRLRLWDVLLHRQKLRRNPAVVVGPRLIPDNVTTETSVALWPLTQVDPVSDVGGGIVWSVQRFVRSSFGFL